MKYDLTHGFRPGPSGASVAAMPSMPDRSVLAAAGTLFVCALAGLYLGVSRAGPAGADDTGEGEIVPAVTPVSSAKAIVAPAPTMDEAEVRRLAREEATSLLAARAAPKKSKPTDADADQTDTATPPGGEVTPLIPTPVPPPPSGAATPPG